MRGIKTPKFKSWATRLVEKRFYPFWPRRFTIAGMAETKNEKSWQARISKATDAVAQEPAGVGL